MCKKIRNCSQYVLDRLYEFRRWLMNAIVWSAIRLAAYEIPFEVVKQRTKPKNREHKDLHLDNAGDLGELLKTAEAQTKEATTRRTIVTDKCKTLFTFNTALLALIAFFQGKISELARWEFVLFYVAVISFLVALLVLWAYFDVGGELVISLKQDLVSLGKDDVQKSLINSNLECASEMDNRTDYLVDLYRTSRFYLMIGFVLLFITFSSKYFFKNSESTTDKVIRRLHDDEKFKEMVKEAVKSLSCE